MERVLESSASPRCLDELHAFLGRVWTQAPQLGEARRRRMTIALAELVGNVVRHGRTPEGGAPQIHLRVTIEGEAVRAVLTDDGLPVPADAPPAAEDPLAESGRGIALARAAVDELAYERAAPGNRWSVLVRTG